MTQQGQAGSFPPGEPTSAGAVDDTDSTAGGREAVGAGDVEADAVRSGAADGTDVDIPQESDGEPVGRADAEADAARTGADPDEV